MSKQRNKSPQQKKSPSTSQLDHSIAAVTQYSGPIPPPHTLASYEEIQPGFADRIIKMAETETAHRHEMEEKALKGDIESRK